MLVVTKILEQFQTYFSFLNAHPVKQFKNPKKENYFMFAVHYTTHVTSQTYILADSPLEGALISNDEERSTI